MTELLRRAFEEASKLPPEEQDAFAAQMLEELQAESRWAQTLALPASQKLLSRLAEAALVEYQSGDTEVLDPDQM